jgi:hypothetical protein
VMSVRPGPAMRNQVNLACCCKAAACKFVGARMVLGRGLYER